MGEVKKKEREATGTVRSLETDLQKEYSEHEKESKQGTDEIKKLKEELQELKTRLQLRLRFLRRSSAPKRMQRCEFLRRRRRLFKRSTTI